VIVRCRVNPTGAGQRPLMGLTDETGHYPEVVVSAAREGTVAAAREGLGVVVEPDSLALLGANPAAKELAMWQYFPELMATFHLKPELIEMKARAED